MVTNVNNRRRTLTGGIRWSIAMSECQPRSENRLSSSRSTTTCRARRAADATWSAELRGLRRRRGRSIGLGDAVDVGDRVGADGGDRVAGHDEADQVERVGGVDDDPFARAGKLARVGQLLGGGRQRVLLA